jgi:hypothetical protein
MQVMRMDIIRRFVIVSYFIECFKDFIIDSMGSKGFISFEH